MKSVYFNLAQISLNSRANVQNISQVMMTMLKEIPPKKSQDQHSRPGWNTEEW